MKVFFIITLFMLTVLPAFSDCLYNAEKYELKLETSLTLYPCGWLFTVEHDCNHTPDLIVVVFYPVFNMDKVAYVAEMGTKDNYWQTYVHIPEGKWLYEIICSENCILPGST